MPACSRRTLVRPPTEPSQPHSPPGRLSGWTVVSRLTNVTVLPGATRSTVGVKHRSIRATVVPTRPSVAGAWQPPPAEAGAAASTVAASTASSGTNARSRRRGMAALLGSRTLVPALHRTGRPGSPGSVLGLGPGAAGGHGDLQRHLELVDALHVATDELGQPVALAGDDLEHELVVDLEDHAAGQS